MSASLQEIVDELVDAGVEHALQAAVVRDGELIAGAAGGPLRPGAATGPSVDEQTLFPVFSVSKGVTALTAYRYVERGAVRFDTRLAEVWPGFASAVTLGEVLAHTAGLAPLPPVRSVAELCDWDLMTRALADAVPEGRGEPRYHGLTYGWLVGETIRRAAGETRGFGEIVRSELFAVGPSDFWFGIPDEVEGRIATVVRDVEPVDDDRPLSRVIPARFGTTQSVYGRADVRRACLPGVNGIGNALTLASLYARAASGRVVDPVVLDEGTRLASHQVDGVMGSYVARGLGVYVAAPAGETWEPPFAAGAATFGHPGAGGSLAWGDRVSGTGFALCRSRLTGDGWRHPQVQRVVSAMLRAARA